MHTPFIRSRTFGRVTHYHLANHNYGVKLNIKAKTANCVLVIEDEGKTANMFLEIIKMTINPVPVISGGWPPDEVTKGFDVGPTGYLTKPVTFQTFLENLQNHTYLAIRN